MNIAWESVGSLSEVVFHPLLIYDSKNKCIDIKPVFRNDMDYYLQYNLKTNICIKKVLKSNIIDPKYQKKFTLTQHDNIGFSDEYKLCFLNKNTNKWYSTIIPYVYDDDNDVVLYTNNFSYLLFNNYIIIFGGMLDESDDQIKDDIIIFDFVNLKWFYSAIKLPICLSMMSCLLIPKYNNNIIFILSYWFRKDHMDSFPNELINLIIKYYPCFSVFIFGGMTNESKGNDVVYSIDLIEILNYLSIQLQIEGHNDYKPNDIQCIDLKDIKFSDITQNPLEDIICFEPVRDCICIPCKHVVCEKECMESNFLDFLCDGDVHCVWCSMVVTSMYQVMS